MWPGGTGRGVPRGQKEGHLGRLLYQNPVQEVNPDTGRPCKPL